MRTPRITLALAALLALAACGNDATAPTDAELLGTWSIQPTDGSLPGGLRQMTVQFGPGGAFSMESATFTKSAIAPGLLAYGKSVGSVEAGGGELRFHPSGSMTVDRRAAGARSPFDAQEWALQHPVGYQVVGNRLILRLPPLSPEPVMVFTRHAP
ncbi:hypothetical protein [Longimicrobium sp.]|uniref:hypothetical protein n=1 Tax=Longimicrobium sp. TaxID=2029185 RepID=UPI002B6BC007|nr:hypothetical protein [Longimicrobium sp.]HSU16001.1 hypothetical protein [Longimicrobium sp.]